MRNISFITFAGAALFLASGSGALAETRLDLVGIWDSGTGEGTEVISVQGSTGRAALTNSEEGTVSILDLSDPANPALIGTPFDLGIADGEGVNGVAFHPTENYFAVAIQVTGADYGRVELRSATDGAVLNSLTTGSEPDAVAIDKMGRHAVVSDEGESFKLVDGEFVSPPGSVTVIDLRHGAAAATATTIALPDATGTPGMVSAADQRFLERGVDLNGDGEIADEFEDGVGGFDENGKNGIEDRDFVAGYIDGIPVWGNEEAGELVMVPLLDNSPRFLEPEIGAFARNGQIAYVAMQENNGVAVVNVSGGKFIGYIGLGTTTHDADIIDNDDIEFVEDALFALREPDGIAVTPNGRYFVTADEGDTDPKASKTDMPDFPTAGGRTVSVFDAATGLLLGDTGAQLDLAADSIGTYPDGRSDSKGAEPENLTAFSYRGTEYVAVGLERADTVALVSLADPANPSVVSVAAVNPGTDLGGQAPEGIAHYEASDGETYVYTANEKSGVVSIFMVAPF